MRSDAIPWTIVLFLCLSITSYAQHRPPSPKGDPTDMAPPPSEADEARDRVAVEMAKKANLQRQAALKSDADKLLKLATELKGYVDKSNENVLSLDVLKKAEEIEKLAKSVKEKMKGPN